MGETEKRGDDESYELALLRRLQAMAADPAARDVPPLAERYPELFREIGLGA